MSMAMRCSRIGLAVTALLLTACGAALDAAGSGGDGNRNNTTGDINKTTPDRPGSLVGVAKDGLVQNGTVNAYVWTGTRGKLLGSTTTDGKGKYSLPLQVRSQAVLLEVVGGTYREESTQTTVSFGNQDAIYAVQNYIAGKSLPTAITYHTTLAAGLAENLVRLGMEPAAAIEVANTRVGRIVDFDIRDIMPTDVVEPDGVSGAGLQYGFATAALSSLTERVGIMNGSQPHTGAFTSIKFIQAAYDDIRADGLLDGKGQNGDVVLGRIRLTSEIYRRELALHILRIANNKTANRTGLGPLQVFDLAQRLNSSTDAMFGTDPIIPLDRDKPNVSALVAREFPNLTNGAVVFGSLNLSAMVTTFPGAAKSELIVDNQVLASATDPENPSLSFDSLNPQIGEGRHTLKLRVTDLSGAVGESPALDVTVSNQQVAIATIDIEGKLVGKPIQVTTVVSDPAGFTSVVYSVRPMGRDAFMQVATAPIEAGATTFPASATFDPGMLPEGEATFRVEVTNSVGVTRSREAPFIIDRQGPIVSIAPVVLDATNPSNGQFFNDNVPCTPVQPATESDPCVLYARSTFNIVADATDNRALDSIVLQVPEVGLMRTATPTEATRSLSRTFPIDPTNLVAMDGTKDGPRNIAITAKDKAMNDATARRRVVFDSTLPQQMSLTVKATEGRGTLKEFNGRMVARGALDISGTVRDAVGLAYAELGLDLTLLSQLVSQPTVKAINQGTDPVTLSVAGLDTSRFQPDAPHGFGLNATDRAGNQLFAIDGRAFELDFDNTAPVIELDNTIIASASGSGSCVIAGTVREPHGPPTLQRNATVLVRPAGSGQPFEIQSFMQAENGTPERRIPAPIDVNGRFDFNIVVDGSRTEAREFRIELSLVVQDGLGNTATTVKTFNATANLATNQVTCTQ